MVALLLSAPRGAALQKMPGEGQMPAEQIPVATVNAVCHAQRRLLKVDMVITGDGARLL